MRALLIVLDGAGCGPAPDAAAFGDPGADTLGQLFEARPELELPALFSLGFWKSVTGDVFSPRSVETHARWGRMRPASAGKDTIAGHWELAGAIMPEPFAVHASLPPDMLEKLSAATGFTFLGNTACTRASTMEELAAEHFRTGAPILYTSSESELQIAAHERVLAPARLQEICRKARRLCDAWRIGRVIARPFRGEPGAFEPAARQVYPMVPPRTVLNAIAETGLAVNGIGSISSIFAGSGITRAIPARNDAEAVAAIEQLWEADEDSFIFASLGDFGGSGGHPPGVHALAERLVKFDAWLGPFLDAAEDEDLLMITAVHGRDPASPTGAPTREEVPLLVRHGGARGPLGTRKTFADVAATLAQHFRTRGGWLAGKAF